MKIRIGRLLAWAWIALAGILPAAAQQSASFKVSDGTVNAGGRPADGLIAGSASFRVRLDAIGDTALTGGAYGSAFRTDSGFVARYPAPAEVRNLRFLDATTIEWDAEISTGTYSVYRDHLTNFSGGFGVCLQGAVIPTTATDPEIPSIGKAFFYLTAARNRINEEGTLGNIGGTSIERAPAARCP